MAQQGINNQPGRRRARSKPRADHKSPVRAKGKRTREEVLQAAELVFERDGFLEARVADIAKEAGVSHGTFYTYFDSKEDVFREVASLVINEMYEALDDAAASSQTAFELIRAANRAFVELYRRRARILALIEQVATFDDFFREMRLDLRHRLIERVEHAVARMSASGEVALQPIDPHVLANALGGMVEGFCYAWFVLKEPFDSEAALETLDHIWSRVLGLTTAEGP